MWAVILLWYRPVAGCLPFSAPGCETIKSVLELFCAIAADVEHWCLYKGYQLVSVCVSHICKLCHCRLSCSGRTTSFFILWVYHCASILGAEIPLDAFTVVFSLPGRAHRSEIQYSSLNAFISAKSYPLSL